MTGGGGATTTGGGGGAYTTAGGGAYTTGAATAGRPPNTPVPEMIWLKTANAPRASAASVDEPASASAGLNSTRTSATTRHFFMSSSSFRVPARFDFGCGSPFLVPRRCRRENRVPFAHL